VMEGTEEQGDEGHGHGHGQGGCCGGYGHGHGGCGGHGHGGCEDKPAPDASQEQTQRQAPGPGTDLDAAEVAEVADPVVELEAQVSRLKEDQLRLLAEMENVRKRAARDVESERKYGLERFVEAFLPVKDSLDLGAAAADKATDIETLKEGGRLTSKMFEEAFARLGIETLDPQGSRFDPAFHQAIGMQESAETEPNTVVVVVQKGYLLHKRLLRPALVMVAKAPG